MKKRPWRKWAYGGPDRDGRNLVIPCVYVLKGPNNLCKIGLSKEPIWRIRKHRGDCGSPLELICLIRHLRAADLETSLHHYYALKRATIQDVQALGWDEDSMHDLATQTHEWFWLSDADVKVLRRKSTEEVDNCG